MNRVVVPSWGGKRQLIFSCCDKYNNSYKDKEDTIKVTTLRGDIVGELILTRGARGPATSQQEQLD